MGKGKPAAASDSVTKVSNFLPPSPEKPKNRVVIDLCYSPSPESDQKRNDTPLRPVVCLKNRESMKEMEDREDCFILGFDPDDPFCISSSSSASKKNLDHLHLDDASPDISVIAERGQVACRDYPHPRHLCVKYPFAKTHHESYCELCYCFVCDAVAPCKKWIGIGGHCHAIDNAFWKLEREVTQLEGRIIKSNVV